MADNPCFELGDEAKGAAGAGAEKPPPPPPPAGSPSGAAEPVASPCERARRVCRLVSVEPIVTAYYITASLTALGVQNMLLYKACWPQGVPASRNATCPSEEDSQRLVADINAWKPFVMHTLPVLCLAFAGSWSDYHGGRRKPLMIVPLVGSMCVNVSLLLNAVFWRWPPLATALADALPYGLSGGQGVLNIGVMGHIADTTSHRARTTRIGVVMAFVFLGSPIGLALGGVLSEALGLVGLFATCALINGLALLYGVLHVRETGGGRRPPPASGGGGPGGEGTAPHAARFCDLSTLRQAVRIVTKPRSGFKRSSLIMLLCANPFVVGPLIGEASVLFLFVRVKFGWSPFEYGVYACFKMTIILVGTLGSITVFCHWLQLDDSKIGMMACSFQTVAYIMYSCVNTGWAMYIVPFLELMLGAGITVQKSIVSKLVPNSEMGQVTALLSINEAIVPLIVNPMYNKLYQKTLSVMPGAFYYLGASLAFPGAVIFCMVYILNRNVLESRKKDEELNYTSDKTTSKQTTVIHSITSKTTDS